MKYNPKKHNRKSTRLKGWNYARPGAYFVTLCVQRHLCLFDSIIDGEMILNEAGDMVDTIWKEMPLYYEGTDIDEYIVMPNHLHGIIIIENDHVGAPPCGRPLEGMEDVNSNSEPGQAQGPAPTEGRSTIL